MGRHLTSLMRPNSANARGDKVGVEDELGEWGTWRSPSRGLGKLFVAIDWHVVYSG